VSAAPPLSQCHRLGRPPLCPLETAIRVLKLRDQGLSYTGISVVLNREGVPTPAGQLAWQKSYVDRVLHTQYAKALWEEIGTTSAEVADAAIMPDGS
jgi:hypothetical protein